MSDQTLEPEPSATELPEALGGDPATNAIVDNVLSLEKVLSAARLVERTARICLRGDLEAELLDTLEDLGGLVDADGTVLQPEEATLEESNTARAQALSDRVQEIREEMADATYTVRFRALNDDAWQAFEAAHRGPDGKPKNLQDYNAQIIAATAIAPAMKLDEVKQLRGSLSSRQMTELANTAYAACTQGGLDVPKLPRFSLVPKPAE